MPYLSIILSLLLIISPLSSMAGVPVGSDNSKLESNIRHAMPCHTQGADQSAHKPGCHHCGQKDCSKGDCPQCHGGLLALAMELATSACNTGCSIYPAPTATAYSLDLPLDPPPPIA